MPKEVELVPLSGGLAASWVMTGDPHQCPSEVLPQWQLCCDFPWCQEDTMKGVMLAQAPQSYRWPWDGSCGEKAEDVRLSVWSLWDWQSYPTGYCHLLPSPLTPPRSYFCFSLYQKPGQRCLSETSCWESGWFLSHKQQVVSHPVPQQNREGSLSLMFFPCYYPHSNRFIRDWVLWGISIFPWSITV